MYCLYHPMEFLQAYENAETIVEASCNHIKRLEKWSYNPTMSDTSVETSSVAKHSYNFYGIVVKNAWNFNKCIYWNFYTKT